MREVKQKGPVDRKTGTLRAGRRNFPARSNLVASARAAAFEPKGEMGSSPIVTAKDRSVTISLRGKKGARLGAGKGRRGGLLL